MNDFKPNEKEELQKLITGLLDAVKQCQIRFGGRTELATEGDISVSCLCSQFEAVFQHGLRKTVLNSSNNSMVGGSVPMGGGGGTVGGASAGNTIMNMRDVVSSFNVNINLTFKSDSEPVFWHFVREFLSRHDLDRYNVLRNITTDIGRGRAWLRSSLNEHSLERYIHMFLSDSDQLRRYYQDSAFMRDQEMSNVLPNMAAGLGSILFAININNSDLNFLKCSIPMSTSCISNKFLDEHKPVNTNTLTDKSKERRKKKRVPPHIVSFDVDELDNESASNAPYMCTSAPATCLSSPADVGARSFTLISKNCTGITNAESSGKLIERDSAVETVDKNQTCNSDLDGSSSLEDCQSPERASDVWDQCTRTEFDKDAATDNVLSKIELSKEDGLLCNDESIPRDGFTAAEVRESSSISEDEEGNTSETNKEQAMETKTGITNDFRTEIQPSKSHYHRTMHNLERKRIPEAHVGDSHTSLTPVMDTSVGELFPITNNEEVHSEDSVSIPSYSEDTDNAAIALVMVQKALHNAPNLPSSYEKNPNSSASGHCLPATINWNDNFSNGDLKLALLTTMQKRDELEDQNRSLSSLLEKEMELNAGLRVENEELKKRQAEKIEKLQFKLQTLNRENELLKHQLKKYVGAVQMLKRDGTHAHEALTCLTREGYTGSSESHNFIDYHFETKEYEKKLIQVAEMHGELMEFNERLHRLLSQKEQTVRRLREELVDLRGPLPDDGLTSDDDISITSDYDTSSMTAAARALINVWIPSVFLTGKSSDMHHVYQVYVRIRDDEWNIYRRYAQFYSLHKDLKKKDPVINTFDFPPKKVIGNKDAKFVEERRKRLQHYIRCVVNLLVQSNSDLASNPDKESLINLLPFFGEYVNQPNRRRNRQRRGPSLFSSSPSQTSDTQPCAHYTGL